MTRLIGEQGVLRTGSTIMSFLCLLIMTYTPYSAKMLWWLMPVFLSSVAGFVFFMPYTVTGTAAILSRAVPAHRQATVQGLRTSFERFGQILGPLLAAEALSWN